MFTENKKQESQNTFLIGFIVGFIFASIIIISVVNGEPDYNTCDPMISDECYTFSRP